MPRLIGAAQTTQAKQVTTFNSSGTLTTQPQTTAIEYLVVAGGGGGAAQANGGRWRWRCWRISHRHR